MLLSLSRMLPAINNFRFQRILISEIHRFHHILLFHFFSKSLIHYYFSGLSLKSSLALSSLYFLAMIFHRLPPYEEVCDPSYACHLLSREPDLVPRNTGPLFFMEFISFLEEFRFQDMRTINLSITSHINQPRTLIVF